MKETIVNISDKIATNEYVMNCKVHVYNYTYFFLKNSRNVFIKRLQKFFITGLTRNRMRNATLNLSSLTKKSTICVLLSFFTFRYFLVKTSIILILSGDDTKVSLTSSNRRLKSFVSQNI